MAVATWLSDDVQEELKSMVFSSLREHVDGDVTAAWMVVGTQKFGYGDLD